MLKPSPFCRVRYNNGIVIDLSDRILQTSRAMPPALPQSRRLHPVRRALQVSCGIALVLLPLTNGLRLDVRAEQFYFLWHRMTAHDLVLLFWAAMLGVWTLVTVSFLYGRVWCGTVCPQTLLSDFAVSMQTRLDKALRARSGHIRFMLSRALWVSALLAMSVGTGYVLTCYWLAPHTVARAIRTPRQDPTAALTVFSIAAVVLMDMTVVRRRFCSHFCPYGALMSTLSDTNTLSARFLTERADECITCHKCETDCPMGIDIKQGVGQLSCIGCGECVDACNDVLGRRGASGLIQFRYGTEPERATSSLTVAQKLGLWDARRVGVAVTLFVFLGITLWTVFGTRPLQASAAANGAIVHTRAGTSNTYTLTLTGGGPHGADCLLSVDGFAGATITPHVVHLEARDTLNIPVTVSIPFVRPGRQRIKIVVRSESSEVHAPAIFYTP